MYNIAMVLFCYYKSILHISSFMRQFDYYSFVLVAQCCCCRVCEDIRNKTRAYANFVESGSQSFHSLMSSSNTFDFRLPFFGEGGGGAAKTQVTYVYTA